jgi:hypothetical protein
MATRLKAVRDLSLWLGVCAGGLCCEAPEAFRTSPWAGAEVEAGTLPVTVPDAEVPAPLLAPSPVAGGVDPCARRNWTFIPRFTCDTPACADVPASAKNPFNAIDGMPDTRYTSGRAQGSAGPETVVLQLPRPAALTGLTLLTTSGDGPTTYLAEYSSDGTTFRGFTPAVFGAGSETTSITFPATTMRAARVTQTGLKPTNWWSINELNVVGCVPQ